MGLEVFDHYECDGQMEIENTVPVRKLTHLSLFSGIGGLDLAAEWAGFESMGQCEYADYPTKILAQHWPDVPRWRDIRTLTGESFYERTGLRTIDIISGGFPCQPFSVAGKQRGKEDDRYLWPEMVRVITELRPTWVIGENVAGIIHMALDTVLSDLEGQGYATRTFLIPACGVNAPHQRYRTAIVACAKGHNSGGLPIRKETENARFSSSEDVPNPHGAGCQKLHLSRITDTKRFTGGELMRERYATPQARDYRTGQASRWKDTKHRSRNLNDQIAMYPIPTCGSLCGGKHTQEYVKKLEKEKIISAEKSQSMQVKNGGQLNPTWVEWLMGFPIGGTELRVSETL